MSADAPAADELRKRAPGLLATKLYLPSPRPNGVVRTRLLHLLDGGSAARLILLSAPAGYGKTTLLAAWLHQGDRRAGWLALDAADNDPARFLAYLVAALPLLSAGHAGELADLLRPPEPSPVEAVLAALVNEAAQNPEEGWRRSAT